MRDWQDISYLKLMGTQRQQEAFETTMALGILDKLAPFHPTLVSTVCVEFDIEESDLDFICQFDDPAVFEAAVRSNFGDYENFSFWQRQPDKSEIAAAFHFMTFPIQIFGSTVSVKEQNAYRHLNVMARLAMIGGKEFRYNVRELKGEGFKTEPALAKLLGLRGDPYQAILELEELDDFELEELIEEALMPF
ncbi:uncharacterized conserved protein [Candidatus Vecturithrix granuli]|uniref:Uncharacterized conserved protein n=1 Tax=Vecturithrix granuli TaxID=1499967 RepID=A0A0S6W6T7_VECG1|nr:uncharacterized conserved protein [Candidatus Vecturithrix granuli]